MADIQMCGDKTCPFRTRCKRSSESGTPVSEHWQAYGAYHHDTRGHCDDAWPIHDEDIDEDGRIRIRIRVRV